MSWPVVRNIIVYGPFAGGFGLLILGRVMAELRGSSWTAAALLLVAASCLLEALLPGWSRLTAEQVAALRHYNIPYREGVERAANGGAGIILVLVGLWFLLG